MLGAPCDHILPVQNVQLAAGAGFVVIITDTVMVMPGLPSSPNATAIDLCDNGQVSGIGG